MSIKDNYPAIKPSLNLDFSNTKTLDSRITFSRPTGAVYYDGKTVSKAEENLFSYSQEFDNAYWSKYYATVAANSVLAPDGTTTADTLTFTNTVGAVYKPSVLVGQNVVSIHAKQGTNRYIAIIVAGNSTEGGFVVFDLLDGVVGQTVSGTSTTGVSGTITSLSNGFYRCAMTFTKTATANVKIELAPALSGNTLDGSGEIVGNTIGNNVYLWGAQLEQRSTVTAYTPTTTQPITNYIPTLLTAPADSARFDHDPVTGESLGLLVEEQRTNLQIYSEDFSNVTWNKAGATVTSNTIVAPDGTLTGDKLVESTDNSTHAVWDNSGSVAIGAFTATAYLKAAEKRYAYLYVVAIGEAVTISVDLLSGTIVNTLGVSVPQSILSSITPVGNGWYRVSIGFANEDAAVGLRLQIGSLDVDTLNASAPTYTGDGYSGIYIWGAQLEAGSFPTSYVKTEASQVTRSADSASISNQLGWFNESAGTVYWNGTLKEPSASEIVGLVNYSNAADFNGLGQVGGNSWRFSVDTINNTIVTGGRLFNTSSGYADKTETKLAGSFQVGQFVTTAVNGVTLDGTVTLTNGMYSNTNSFNFIRSGFEGVALIKKLSYYPQRLTNTQLQALTS